MTHCISIDKWKFIERKWVLLGLLDSCSFTYKFYSGHHCSIIIGDTTEPKSNPDKEKNLPSLPDFVKTG